MRDIEYPPLLAEGFKDIAEADLHEEFVAPFHSEPKNCRVNLLIGFGNFLNEFKRFIRNNYQVEVFYAVKGNEADYHQWQNMFGTCYDNTTPKGIFRLTYAR